MSKASRDWFFVSPPAELNRVTPKSEYKYTFHHPSGGHGPRRERSRAQPSTQTPQAQAESRADLEARLAGLEAETKRRRQEMLLYGELQPPGLSPERRRELLEQSPLGQAALRQGGS